MVALQQLGLGSMGPNVDNVDQCIYRALLRMSEGQSLSRVRLFATPWTVACQAPLSMEFPGKNTGVGSHSLLQGIFRPRDRTQVSHIAGRFFTI